MGERLDQLSEAWDGSQLLRLIAPVLCVAWEAMMFSRAAFLGDATGADAEGSALWGLLALLTAACCLLFIRHRFPLPVLGAELVLVLEGSAFGRLPLTYPLPMVALYACASRGPWRFSIAGMASYLFGMMFALLLDGGMTVGADGITVPGFAPGGAVSIGVFSLAVAGAACTSHVRWDRRNAAAEERRRDEERAAELDRMAAARDEALAKSRVAAELHDSVGHDLTAIIALSEGLAGAGSGPDFDMAVAAINDLARAGLENTRCAVRALAAANEAPCLADHESATAGHAHRWDEISGLLAPARAVGVAAMLTETGKRPSDTAQADLAFRVVRESVTNALRHAPDIARITVSIDHAEEGGTTVTVRNDGAGEGASTHGGTGMGLARLCKLVEAVGGAFSSRREEPENWIVRAELKGADDDGPNR